MYVVCRNDIVGTGSYFALRCVQEEPCHDLRHLHICEVDRLATVQAIPFLSELHAWHAKPIEARLWTDTLFIEEL